MASLIEHAMVNKLVDDLRSSMRHAGAFVSNDVDPSQFATIIREQLSGPEGGITIGKDVILSGYSCIIEADENGCNDYNNEYYAGSKTGLNPNTLYLRICPAVIDGVPIYIDLSRIIDENKFDAESLTKEDINNIIRDK